MSITQLVKQISYGREKKNYVVIVLKFKKLEVEDYKVKKKFI